MAPRPKIPKPLPGPNWSAYHLTVDISAGVMLPPLFAGRGACPLEMNDAAWEDADGKTPAERLKEATDV